MALINEITSAQQAKIPEYRERFLKIGLSTDAANRPEAEKALHDYYNYMKEKNPTVLKRTPIIVWKDSPMEGARLAAKALNYPKGQTDFVLSECEAVAVTADQVRDQAGKASYGSFEAYYVSFYSFVANELPVPRDPLVDIAERLCINSGAFWMFDGLIIATEKPCEINLDKDEKLHNENGPAIKYPNGDGIYCLHGQNYKNMMDMKLALKLGKTGSED